MTKLGYVLDEIFVNHRAPSGHPERPARAEAVRLAAAATARARLGPAADAASGTATAARPHALAAGGGAAPLSLAE